MTWSLIAAVLCGALLHASWNALVKASEDKSLDLALMRALGALAGAPLLLWLGMPPAAAGPWVAASVLVHLGYYALLAGAYRHGDLTLTYPIMRGLAPVLVAMVSAPLIGESPSPAGWFAVGAVSLGVLLLGGAGAARWPSGLPRMPGLAVRYAAANAAIIATYTVIDGHGIRTTVENGGHAMQYVGALFLFGGAPFLVLLLWQRGPAGRADAWRVMRRRAPVLLAGILASFGSYALALWAMTRAPVAAVAALRETAVLFAALIGTRWLGERFGPGRAAGTALVLAGVAALRLA